jgi:hypothetical protein
MILVAAMVPLAGEVPENGGETRTRRGVQQRARARHHDEVDVSRTSSTTSRLTSSPKRGARRARAVRHSI